MIFVWGIQIIGFFFLRVRFDMQTSHLLRKTPPGLESIEKIYSGEMRNPNPRWSLHVNREYYTYVFFFEYGHVSPKVGK